LPKFRIIFVLILGLIVLTACAGEFYPEAVWAETENITVPRGLYSLDSEAVDSEASGLEEADLEETDFPVHTIPGPLTNPNTHTEVSASEEPAPECEEEPFCPFEYAYGRRPMIALTFDDGPGPLTASLVEMLVEHGGYATFCVLGNRVERWADIVLLIIESGSEVIGHSWNHQNFTFLREEAIAAQILDTSDAIEAVTGFPSPPIFRAPYGMVNSRVRRVSRELGFGILNWTIDTEDWLYRDADIIYARVMEQARDGAIVLMHDIHPTTVEAMERVIPELIAKGFQLVTVSYLIEYFYGPIEPGVEYRGLRPGETSRNGSNEEEEEDDE